MCIKQIKRLFCKESCEPLPNEETVKAKELTIEQFNILNNMPKEHRNALELWQLDYSVIHISKEVIKAINSTTLTSEAVSFIDNKDNSIGRKVLLVAEEEGKYFVTEEGLSYLEYYKLNVLNKQAEAEKL